MNLSGSCWNSWEMFRSFPFSWKYFWSFWNASSSVKNDFPSILVVRKTNFCECMGAIRELKVRKTELVQALIWLNWKARLSRSSVLKGDCRRQCRTTKVTSLTTITKLGLYLFTTEKILNFSCNLRVGLIFSNQAADIINDLWNFSYFALWEPLKISGNAVVYKSTRADGLPTPEGLPKFVRTD